MILAFIVLLFALSAPFWLYGYVSGGELMRGVPVAALMFVCPAIAALILVYRQRGRAGVAELLKRGIDYGQITAKAWY